jgi:hypothetical protein
MPAKPAEKIECVNPNTGGKMNIDAKTYELFSKAIYHVLKENKQGLTYTELVDAIKKWFKGNKTAFRRSVEWYAVTVKHDMVANRIIETVSDKGKKLNKLPDRKRSK